MKKHIPILLVFCFISLCTFGQTFSIHQSPEEKAETLLARLSKSERFETERLSATIFWVENSSGSAGNGTCEITHDLWVLVSEFDEAPQTNLFRMSAFYNPKIINWIKASDPQPVLVVEYGPADQRSQASVQITLDALSKI